MAMTAPPSLFQNLPLDIIQMIVDNVISSNKLEYGIQKPMGLAIPHTCMLWRSVFIRSVSHTLCFRFGPYDSSITFLNCPDVINPLDFSATESVRAINVDIRVNSVVADGSALELLESSLPIDVVFPHVRTIVFDLNFVRMYAESANTPHTDSNCFHHLFRHIRKITPNVQKIDVTWNRTVWGSDPSKAVYDIDGAVSELICGIKEVRYMGNSKRTPPVKLNPESISELVSIDIELGTRQECLLQIIRNNASTLRSAKLIGLQKLCAKYFLLDESSEPVVYSSLESLFLENCYERRDHREAAEPSRFTHFPALRRLDIMPLCPFLSNLVYNCQSSLLETLRILIEGPASLFGLSYQPFKSSDFTNLKTLDFCYGQTKRTGVQGAVSVLNTVAREFAGPVLNSTTAVRKVRLDGRMDRYRLFPDISACHWLYSVKALYIPEVEFDLSNIVLLLQNSPQLNSLACSLKSGIPGISGVSKSKLPTHIKTQLFPISSSLFRFKGKCGRYCSSPHLVFYFLLLTIGCPTLNVIGSSDFRANMINQHVQDLVKTKPFAEYTEAGEKLALILTD